MTQETPIGTALPTSRLKIGLFWGITLAVPVFFLLLAVQAYYLYAYLTFPAYYCNSFAALDSEIGWIPAPNSESCIGGFNPETGEVAFEASVFINADGARTASADTQTGTGDLLILGDSWTFGYGLDWSQTFAAQLEQRHARRTALFASPAFSGAQALLLGRRALPLVQPKVIVYLEMGFWMRAVCTGSTRPMNVLKPCYWTDQGGDVHLVTPTGDAVESAARWSQYPGGAIGAGHMTLDYFLISRPLAKLDQGLVRLGLRSGFGDDFGPQAPQDELDAIRRAQYDDLRRLAEDSGARLLLIDPFEFYASFDRPEFITYLGKADWDRDITGPIADLPEEDIYVPYDNHYGPGVHILIADMIAEALK